MAVDLSKRNIALAIDGGGIKGLMVAKALVELEAKLGGRPLLNCGNIKVLSGTSTGAILTAGIALGMDAQAMVNMYKSLGASVFPRWYEDQPVVIKRVAKVWEVALQLFFRPSLFDNTVLRKILHDLAQQNGVETLADVHRKLNDQATWTDGSLPGERTLVITTVDITERRTRFIKSNDPEDAKLKFEDVILASAAAPTFLPVITLRLQNKRTGEFQDTQCTDGGVGSHGNPAYIAALELLQYADPPYHPGTVSVLSFGTGFLPAANFERDKNPPRIWRLVKWAQNIPIIMIGDAARWQSVDIILKYRPDGTDFRRYQVKLERDIGLDDASSASINLLETKYGEDMAKLVRDDLFAPHMSENIDPEGLYYMVASTRQKQLSKG